MSDLPDPSAAVRAAAARLNQVMTDLAVRMRVWSAMAAMYDGDLDRARSTLNGLPADTLRGVSVAGAALTSLADELLAEAPALEP